MGQNVKEIEMRAAEVPGGGLSGECKGHYQRAKHVPGFGVFFFFSFCWLVGCLIFVSPQNVGHRERFTYGKFTRLIICELKKRRGGLAVQSKLDLSDSLPASDS